MKFNVPFYKSEKDTDCGPLALKMALAYLGKDYEKQEIAQLERQLETGLVWSAGIARAARKLGFTVKFISITNFSHEENIEYYKKYANDKGNNVLQELKEEMNKIGVETIEKDMSINELLSYLSINSIPIVLINWHIISGKPGYSGHFVPISGYTKDYIYINNPGIANPMPHFPVKKEIFQKAWESKGTDKDTIVIFNKGSKI